MNRLIRTSRTRRIIALLASISTRLTAILRTFFASMKSLLHFSKTKSQSYLSNVRYYQEKSTINLQNCTLYRVFARGIPAHATKNNAKTEVINRVLAVVLAIFVPVLGYILLYTQVGVPTASAATNSTINFQARILTNTGALVPDGNYHVEFKIYDSAVAGSSAQGVCSGDSSTDDCWWLETRTTGNLVTVKNGYITANLGSVTSFPANMPWDQELWLTMNIGGNSGSASWDGEMSPRMKVTAVPFAQAANKLQNTNSGITSKLTLETPTVGNQTFVIPDQAAAGTYNLLTEDAADSGYIQNQSSTPQTANFYIQSAGSSTVGAVVRGAASQSAALFKLENSSGADLAVFGSNGQLTLGNDTGTPQLGSITFNDNTATNSYTAVLTSAAALTANVTYRLPAATAGNYDLCTTAGNCLGSGDIIQNGNSYGEDLYIGSNDEYDVNIETFGVARLTVQSDGDIAFDTNTLFVDAANDRVGVGTATPGATLEVVSTDAADVTLSVTGASGQSVNLLEAYADGVANALLTISETGATNFRNSSNSTTAFSIQDANGVNVFNIDTTNGTLHVGSYNSGTNPVAGTIVIGNANNANTITLQGPATPGSSRTISLPDEDGTICLQNSSSCGFVIGSGTAVLLAPSSVQADTTTNSSIYINKTGASGNILQLQKAGSDVLVLDNNGDLTVQNITVSSTKTLQVVGDTYTNISGYGSPSEGQITYDQTNDQLLIYNATLGKWVADKSDAILVAASNSSQADKNAADYVADGEIGDGQTTLDGDQVEINQALTAGAGKKVVLLAGTYTADATILIPNNTTLAGVGAGTLIQLADIDVTDNLIENSDTTTGTGVVIRDLKLDGQKSLNTAGTQHGVSFNGMGDSATDRQGGSVTTVSVNNFRSSGLYLNNSDNNTLASNTAQGNSNGIYVYDSTNNTLTGNTAQDNSNAGIMLFDSSNNTLVGNTAQGNSSEGIVLSIFSTGSNNNTLIGNTAQDNGSTGIYIYYSSNNTLTGNTAQNNNNGIYLSYSSNNTLTSSVTQSNTNVGIDLNSSSNNTLTGNTVQGNILRGMSVSSSSGNTISGNKFHNNGGTTNNNGIYLSASDSNTITGNDITDTSCGTGATSCFAINISNATSDNNYLADNRFSDTDVDATSTINDAGTGTVYSNQPRAENGGKLTIRTADDTEAFQIQNTAGVNVLNYDTINQQLSVRSGSDMQTLGSELYSGTFATDWTTTGWTITGSGSDAEALHNTGNTNPLVYNTFTPTIGNTYQVKFLLNYCAANDSFSVSMGGQTMATFTGASCDYYVYTYIVTATTTDKFTFTPGINSTALVYDYGYFSIKEVTSNMNAAIVVNNNSGTANIELRASSSTTNTFIGLNSGMNNRTGTNNTSLGTDTLKVNTTGDYNIAIGTSALQGNTEGDYNTAVGTQALMTNVAGINNVATGYRALNGNITGSYNTATGNYSLQANTIGTDNTAQGYYSLYSNTTGWGNTAQGDRAMYSNTTGTRNTAQGYYSMLNNTTGSYNTAIGYQSGYQSGASQFKTLNNLQSSTMIGAYAQAYSNNVVALGGQGADAVRVGIGTGTPTGTLSVEPFRYSTGTVSTSNASGTITGSGTTFTSTMIGSRIYIASNSTTTAPYSGTITGYTSATEISVSPAVGFTSSGRSYYINYAGLQVATDGRIGIGTTSPTADLSFGGTANRTINVTANPINAAGYNLTINAGSAGTGASAFSGGSLYLQGGNAAGTGNANGGNVYLIGGTGTGTGVQGLVVTDTQAYETVTNATCGVNCSITQSNVDAYGAIIVEATATGLEISMPDPTITTAGRVIYITAANGSEDFTFLVNGGGQGNEIAMRENTTATMIWNGSDWTAAGASSSTTLQAAYDNTLTAAGGAEIVLNNTTSSNGLTVRNNASNPIIGAIFEAQTSIGSNLFSVNNNATEYATNGGAETAGATSSTFPVGTWSAAPDGGTVSRYTTTGDYISTGQASVSVVTSATADEGADNTLATALTPNLRYRVSYAIRGTAAFSTLDTNYSKDGTTTDLTVCETGTTVTEGIWTRAICTFDAPASGITSSNAIIISQSDATARTFYIENLSVTVSADVNHAVDGDVDDPANFSTYYTAAPAGGTVSRSQTTLYNTSGSAQVVTTAVANEGVRNNLNITPQTSTQYLVSFYALSSNTFNDITVGYSRDGGTSIVQCTDYNTQSVSTSIWTKISCVFTTDGTSPTDADLLIRQASATARTFWVDAISVTLNTNTASNVQIGGGNYGGPVTLFTLDRSDGPPIAANNPDYYGSMYYDTTTGRIQCYESDGWGACGSPPDNFVNLNPEYAGAVLNGTGIGTMNADLCANESGVLSVNSSLCSSGESKNYYSWTSPQASQQTYSIYVSYQLPSTFKGFSSDDTVQLTARVDNTTNAAVTYEMFRSENGSLVQCGTGETSVTTTANTWQTVGINGNEATGCGFTTASAEAYVIFKINVKANSNANAYVSTLSFVTTGK